jgi:hypothetical protein
MKVRQLLSSLRRHRGKLVAFVVLCAPVKPASCMRMKVPLGEGRAAHAGLEHARLSASSAVKRCERKVQAWY